MTTKWPCDRPAGYRIAFEKGGKSDRIFVCTEHLAPMVEAALGGTPDGNSVEVFLHPLANEEPCERGVE